MSLADRTTMSLPLFADARVGCLGDVMLDWYIYGKVDRISPEAPVPVLQVSHETRTLGGVGNVIRNLSALGASCHTAVVVGIDDAGSQITSLLRGLERCQVAALPDLSRNSTVKMRCVAGAQQVVRVDRETANSLSPELEQQLLEELDEFLPTVRTLILSDYAKGTFCSTDLLQAIIQRARRQGVQVLVDPKGRDFTRYRHASLLTPNRLELSQATGLPTRTDEEVVAAAQRLLDTCDLEAVLATRSEEGMTLVTRSGIIEHFPTTAQEVFDVSGAGDTVMATLAACLAVGLTMTEAAEIANVAAGIVVSKIGTATVSPAELRQSLAQRERALGGKLVDRDEARQLASEWQAAGLKVGFTNGCFDLLHPGHVTSLAQAAAQVDRLIVGLNSDSSVTRLKGPSRPVQPENARATVLAALSSVALVTVFSEETPLDLIAAVRPDILFKGADYRLDQVVGADVVRSYGGEVRLLELVPQQSTTRLVQRLQIPETSLSNGQRGNKAA